MTMAPYACTMSFHVRRRPKSCHATTIAVQDQVRLLLNTRTRHTQAPRPQDSPFDNPCATIGLIRMCNVTTLGPKHCPMMEPNPHRNPRQHLYACQEPPLTNIGMPHNLSLCGLRACLLGMVHYLPCRPCLLPMSRAWVPPSTHPSSWCTLNPLWIARREHHTPLENYAKLIYDSIIGQCLRKCHSAIC